MLTTEKSALPLQEPAMLEGMASTLEATGNYRVLRRLIPRAPSAAPDGETNKIGIILDVETSGLDPTRHDVIELAMIKFRYSVADEVTGVADIYQSFNESASPIPPEITKLTGITDAMVAGHKIDAAAVHAFVADANIVIAHNAGFDRKFAERLLPIFMDMPWACSQNDIAWKEHGFERAKLSYLLAGCGMFHDAHRAVDDCHALLEILARSVPGSSQTFLAALLERSRRKTVRIWAQNSPYELKDILKARGYRWSDGADGSLRAWYIDVDASNADSELEFLRREIYQRDIEINCTEMTAFTRFSSRTR